MGIDMKRKIDPAAECIRYLTQKYCVPDPPDSVVVQNCRDFARSYRIPQAELEELTAPLLPLEAELDQVMAEHRSLWEEMFYPGRRGRIFWPGAFTCWPARAGRRRCRRRHFAAG